MGVSICKKWLRSRFIAFLVKTCLTVKVYNPLCLNVSVEVGKIPKCEKTAINCDWPQQISCIEQVVAKRMIPTIHFRGLSSLATNRTTQFPPIDQFTELALTLFSDNCPPYSRTDQIAIVLMILSQNHLCYIFFHFFLCI